MVTGRLTRRGLKCVRLQTEAGGCLEHRRGVWDSVSLMADRDVLITGVGVYSPSGQTQVCVTTCCSVITELRLAVILFRFLLTPDQ